MKNTKKPYLFAITLVIAGLMITSTSISETMTEKTEKLSAGTPAQYTSVTTVQPIVRQMATPTHLLPGNTHLSNSIKLFSRSDVLIFPAPGENITYVRQNPAIATDGFGNILVITEIWVEPTKMILEGRWSTDYGETWAHYLDIEGWPWNISITNPELDYYGEGKKAWGTQTAAPSDSSITYMIVFPDITDPDFADPIHNGWTTWVSPWTDTYCNFDSADVACYSNSSNIPLPYFFGIVALTGDYLLTPYEDNTIVIVWLDFPLATSVAWIYMPEDVMKIKTDIDQATGRCFMVMEYENNIQHQPGSTVRYKDISTNPEWWLGYWPQLYFENFFNPDIAAENNSVYIVGEENNNSQRDIVCYYSFDSGITYTKAIVAHQVIDELYPTVSIAEEKIICLYMRNSNLYTSLSTDNGVTWQEQETPINDVSGSAVVQYNGASLGNQFVAWTDKRDPPTDIYFDTAEANNPPDPPTITGPTNGKAGTEYDYNFTAIDPDGHLVKYHINWGDGNTEWTDDFSASGTPVTVSHIWAEKDTYTITAKAQDEHGLEGPEGILVVTMPVNQQTLNIWFLQFLQNHPRMFPILRQMLGL